MIHELQVAEADGVSELAGVEIHPHRLRWNIIAVDKRLIVGSEIVHVVVIVVSELVKEARTSLECIVQAAERLGLGVGCAETAVQYIQWCWEGQGEEPSLFIALAVDEKEQLVLQNRSAERTAEVVALERQVLAAGEVGHARTLVAA